MKDYDYSEFDMYAFGTELCNLTKYKSMYFNLKEEFEKLQKEYSKLLDSSIQHNQEMIGNFLVLAVKGVEGFNTKE